MADETKTLVALLNGITKRTYYGEEEITNEFLKSEIYPNMSDDEFNSLIAKCASLLKVNTKHHLYNGHTPIIVYAYLYNHCYPCLSAIHVSPSTCMRQTFCMLSSSVCSQLCLPGEEWERRFRKTTSQCSEYMMQPQ